MPRFIVTYVQELTQPVNGPSLEDTGAYAWRYAAEHKLRVLSVYPAPPPADPSLPSLPAA